MYVRDVCVNPCSTRQTILFNYLSILGNFNLNLIIFHFALCLEMGNRIFLFFLKKVIPFINKIVTKNTEIYLKIFWVLKFSEKKLFRILSKTYLIFLINYQIKCFRIIEANIKFWKITFLKWFGLFFYLRYILLFLENGWCYYSIFIYFYFHSLIYIFFRIGTLIFFVFYCKILNEIIIISI